MSIPVNKTLDNVRNDLFGRISTVQQDGWLPENLNLNRGPIRGLIEIWAWGLYVLYQFLSLVLTNAFPLTASGDWLDLHCAQVGVTRLTAVKAQGTVYFTRAGTSGNVNIPTGRIVKTKPDGLGRVYRFATTADAVLPDGALEVAVPVEAEDYGAAANVTVGMISEIATVISGVDGVENRAGWLRLEGSDVETDEGLRQRYVLAWSEINGATKHAYESWARSVSGVAAVRILDQHPRGQGTVDVVVKGAAGVPTQELIASVDAVVQANRPINDAVLVKGPTAVNITISAALELVSGTAADIRTEAENRIRALFQDSYVAVGVTALRIGEDLTLDRLVATVMAIAGVKRIVWTSPTTDVAVAADALAVLTSLTVTTAWASEE